MLFKNYNSGDVMNKDNEKYRFQNAEYSIYSTGFFVFCVVLGVFVLAPMLPPLGQASASAGEIAAFYQENNLMKKIGLSIAMFGLAFIIPLFVLMAEVMKRAMGMPILANVQLASGIFGILFTFMMLIFWGTAAFRPERSVEITQALHDGGWLVATWVGSATLVQVMCICIAVFKDQQANPVFPRWFGYFCMWIIPLGAPACVINIFTQGPFAYDGLFGFWLPYISLFAFFAVMMVALWGAVKKLQGVEVSASSKANSSAYAS
tara:strand:- start:9920 stop:10708 length:789 start_codon:yes stop_codon:yes gene_type:complete